MSETFAQAACFLTVLAISAAPVAVAVLGRVRRRPDGTRRRWVTVLAFLLLWLTFDLSLLATWGAFPARSSTPEMTLLLLGALLLQPLGIGLVLRVLRDS